MRGRCTQVRQPDAVEKLDESLEGVVKHQSIIDRKVWTSPRALQNHTSNCLAEFAVLIGCSHTLADRTKEEVNDLSKIDHRLLVSKTLQEECIGTMVVHVVLEACNCLKNFSRACLFSRPINDCCVQDIHHSCACVIYVSGERIFHDQCICSLKNIRASKVPVAVVQGHSSTESKRNTIRRGLVHELLNAQDTVLCSYFAQRMGMKNDGCGQKNDGEEIFQGLERFE